MKSKRGYRHALLLFTFKPLLSQGFVRRRLQLKHPPAPGVSFPPIRQRLQRVGSGHGILNCLTTCLTAERCNFWDILLSAAIQLIEDTDVGEIATCLDMGKSVISASLLTVPSSPYSTISLTVVVCCTEPMVPVTVTL